MNLRTLLISIRDDRRGGPAIEFALLAPALIVMLLGVLMIGLYMQSYNSVRSVVYDTERYTIVEYQKENKLLPTQIEQVAIAIGSRSPYNFSPDRIVAAVTPVNTGIIGAKRYDLTVSYTPPVINGIMGIQPPTIRQTETIIVPD